MIAEIPLVALGLDKSSMMSDGVSKDDVRSIYRTLYVTTGSIFKMIKEVTLHVSREKERFGLMSRIWSVY
jgi:hypothetical protein